MMKSEIGSYEAKTRLPELLRAVHDGCSFTITNRGKPIAQLVPIDARETADAGRAVEQMQDFMRSHPRAGAEVDIKALINEGRD